MWLMKLIHVALLDKKNVVCYFQGKINYLQC
jgi:hypothetical protein